MNDFHLGVDTRNMFFTCSDRRVAAIAEGQYSATTAPGDQVTFVAHDAYASHVLQ
jgi:hypothetical protein